MATLGVENPTVATDEGRYSIFLDTQFPFLYV